MTTRHIEVHILPTAKDAARLEQAGLPRFDLEPSQCGACRARVGEVTGSDPDAVFWRPFGVVLDGESVDVLCKKCLIPFDKVLRNLYG